MKLNLILFYSVLICCIAVSLYGCREFIEPSISDRKIKAEAPGDHYQSANYNVKFWWDEVDDALTYRLQVVTPRFDSVARLVLDTTVKLNTFSINLEPGDYQWHVRAQNGSSQTEYSGTLSFSIYYSSIKQQKVQLIAPGSGLLTNLSAVNLQWGTLYGATKYHLEIDTNNFANENTLIYNQAIPGQQFTFSFPKDQTYQWRVRAENDTAQAQWSVINTIVSDRTPPDKANLTAPANNQTIALPVSLQWANTSGAARYKLYVLKSDSTTLYSTSFPMSLTNTAYSFNQGARGDVIYWKVSAVDAAGNEGQASGLRHFSIQ